MTRRVVAVVSFALACTASLAAGQRSAPAAAPRPSPTAPPSLRPPAPAPAFRSGLILRGPADPLRPLSPFRGPGRGVLLPGFYYGWGWNFTPIYFDGSVVATPLPADAPTGGLQLDVTPWRSRVYLDGEYVGQVENFKGYYKHLTAPAGPHQIVIVEDGYLPLVLDVLIAPGQTTTYRGTLNEAPGR
ncbi:MAG TPA: PEGA domain-containing protein [Vicinamibacterales bacterium]|nr:PEGA domain-containing protein [Vicinamibacterales bacterium]